MLLVNTTRYHRGKLPHWEIEGGRYFTTTRLGDSLPQEAVDGLQSIYRDITIALTNSDSQLLAQLQRQYFLSMEKYLDAGAGSCALRRPEIAAIVVDELSALDEWLVDVPHFTVMPNHAHALIVPRPACPYSLAEIMKRLKGRSGSRIRKALGGAGPIWQREWFDRWIRDDSEWDRVVDYIRQNPVKARLVARWQDHPWTK